MSSLEASPSRPEGFQGLSMIPRRDSRRSRLSRDALQIFSSLTRKSSKKSHRLVAVANVALQKIAVKKEHTCCSLHHSTWCATILSTFILAKILHDCLGEFRLSWHRFVKWLKRTNRLPKRASPCHNRFFEPSRLHEQ